jgi:hypothetical protein
MTRSLFLVDSCSDHVSGVGNSRITKSLITLIIASAVMMAL